MPPSKSGRRSSFTGKTLGRCTIASPIGTGATATVFEARYIPLKREVAVKILRPGAAGGDDARTKFIDEAKSLARLDHENVVRVFDVVEDEGFLLIIMDLVPGRNLLQVVKEEGPLDPESAVRYARQVAEALAHAHSQKILHRDVKPANIILDEDDDRVVLVDFGNAEAVGAATDKRGTPHYVAPEVFQGKRQDEKTDTYSLGATLFHLLTGEPPYHGQAVAEILQAHEAGKLRAASAVAPDAGIPKSLDALVKRSMAPARGYRFLAHEFVAALDEIAPELAGGGGRTRSRRRRGGRGGRSGGSGGPGAGLWIGVGAVAALVFVAAALGGGKKEPPPSETPATTTVKESPTAVTPPAEDGAASKDPGIDKRESGRVAREREASKAFADAEEFESRNILDPAKVADRWKEVAAEYGELSVGRKAREREIAFRAKIETAAQREEREKAAAAEKSKREAEAKRIDERIAAMEFEEALHLLQRQTPPPEGEREWARRVKRLELLQDLKEGLSDGMSGNPVPLSDVRPGLGSTGEEAIEAGESGVKVRATDGSMRMIAWSALSAEDVLALGRAVLRSRPDPRLSLAAWAWERGLRKQAMDEVMTAVMTDRTGTVRSRAEDAFGEL